MTASAPHSITIPFGVLDFTTVVETNGTVTLDPFEDTPSALAEIASKVLGTWMIALDLESWTADLLVPCETWFTYFGHRCQEAA